MKQDLDFPTPQIKEKIAYAIQPTPQPRIHERIVEQIANVLPQVVGDVVGWYRSLTRSESWCMTSHKLSTCRFAPKERVRQRTVEQSVELHIPQKSASQHTVEQIVTFPVLQIAKDILDKVVRQDIVQERISELIVGQHSAL